MADTILHITNGDSLTERLQALDISGDILTWREMLCEGPTAVDIDGNAFAKSRKAFFKEHYEVPESHYETQFLKGLEKLDDTLSYEAIILWFEYDLFCHINMLAAISLLSARNRKEAVYLVCSGRVTGATNLLGLSELSNEQLLAHYQDKTRLDPSDLSLATTLWKLYCSENHNALNPLLAKDTNFKYLSNCLGAHRERFPDKNTGLSTLETQILRLIDTHEIRSERQLCGYALQHQGYYGYGDTQLFRMIKRLDPFYDTTSMHWSLKRSGTRSHTRRKNSTGNYRYFGRYIFWWSFKVCLCL